MAASASRWEKVHVLVEEPAVICAYILTLTQWYLGDVDVIFN